MSKTNANNSIYDITIRLLILLLIVAWCLIIMLPFVHIILWGIILAIALLPMHTSLTKRIGGRAKLASVIIGLTCLAIIVVPSFFFLESIVESVIELRKEYQAGRFALPILSEEVKTWPIIGERIYKIWSADNLDLEKFIMEYKTQLASIGKKIASGVLGAVSGLFQMVGALLIAGVLLVVKGTGESLRQFFRKIAGSKGDYYGDVVKVTIGKVVKGVLGVALIQGFLIGVGLILADIPFAGLWTILALVLAILQISPSLVTIPVMIYMFSVKEPLPAILWSVYLFIGGISDNILKPILLGKGAPVPMLVIFIGVIGGFIFSGFIGLFTGAIVMSIGYKLYIGWVRSAELDDTESVLE